MFGQKIHTRTVGEIPIENRDSFLHKKLHTAGSMLLIQFYSAFKRLCLELQKYTLKKPGGVDNPLNLDNVLSYIHRKTTPRHSTLISTSLIKALSNNRWTADIPKTSGIADKYEIWNVGASLSELRRAKQYMKSEAAVVVKPRNLEGSQRNVMCAAETPEGKQVGLVKRLAAFAVVSNGINDLSPIIGDLLERLGVVLTDACIANGTDLFLNGEYMGQTDAPDQLMIELKKHRKNGPIPSEVSITHYADRSEINLQSEQGRLMRPVFIVTDGKIMIPEGYESMTIQQLIRSGCMQLVDKKEDEGYAIASSLEIFENFPGSYSHMELDPCAMLGVNANFAPKSNHNQGPRLAYTTGMSKQAMGIPCANYRWRMSNTWHVMRYLQRPVCGTRMQDYAGYTEYPAGTNAVVMVAPIKGANQEDSVAIDCGVNGTIFAIGGHARGTSGDEQNSFAKAGVDGIDSDGVAGFVGAFWSDGFNDEELHSFQTRILTRGDDCSDDAAENHPIILI